MVQTFVVALQLGSVSGMLKAIMSRPGLLLASMIACRSVPVPAPGAGSTPPLSPVLVTVKVVEACDLLPLQIPASEIAATANAANATTNPALIWAARFAAALRRSAVLKRNVTCFIVPPHVLRCLVGDGDLLSKVAGQMSPTPAAVSAK